MWIEIIIKAPIEALDRAEAALHMATPLGLYIEDYSDLEQVVKSISGIDSIEDELIAKDRRAALLHVYFPPGDDPAGRAAEVRARLDAAGCDGYAVVSVDGILEEDWANNWKRYFKPLRVGKGILIVPEWEKGDYAASAKNGAIAGGGLFGSEGVTTVVSIDPGMAFGTGGHASTRMCLELLEEVLDDKSRINVLDIGSGSGILSVAAVLLGASSALGVDVDAYAVRNAEINAANNGVADKTRFVTGDLTTGLTGKFHIILANIVADVIIRLLENAGGFLRPGGVLIASGIIDERERDVVKAAQSRGFTIRKTVASEGWTALLLSYGAQI